MKTYTQDTIFVTCVVALGAVITTTALTGVAIEILNSLKRGKNERQL